MNGIRVLFLDDDSNRRQGFLSRRPHTVVVETAAEAIGGRWDEVYLDHDLGGEVYVDSSRPDTGMEVVRWVVANKPIVRQFIVHSLNHPAATAMVETLERFGYDAVHIPFTKLIRVLKGELFV